MFMESIISPKIRRETGKDVWREYLRMAIFAADKVRTTLGPKGAYKLVAYNRGPEQVSKVTKDAITILEELAIQYPPAIIISEAAKQQREEAGDGVTGFVIFLSALLKKADELLTMGIHANTIIHGYHLATEKALEALEQQTIAIHQNTDILDVVDCQRKLLTQRIKDMIEQAYSLAISEERFEKETIRFLKKKGGNLQDSSFIKGVIIKKEKVHPNMPNQIRNLRVAITSSRLGINRSEIKMVGQGPAHIHLSIKAPEQISKFRETEYRLKTQPIEKLAKRKVTLLICEQPLDDFQKEKLFSLGIFALENVDKKDTWAVSKATGAKIVGNLSELSEDDIGFAEKLYTSSFELEKMVTIEGCKGATFILRGSSQQTIDEFETSIKNSMTILDLLRLDNRIISAGGAVETHIAEVLKNCNKEFACREQLVIEAYSSALMDVPRCLAENYGLNPTDTIIELRKLHADGFHNFGIGEKGCTELPCKEIFKVKRSVIRRAYEVSTMMLRIDELLISKEIAKFHKQ
jgi:chaperonin GroEL (HSP60 family)